MREITLTRGHVALVDDEDFEWLSQWSWHAFVRRDPDGCIKNVYAKRTTPRDCFGRQRAVLMHVEIAKRHGLWREDLQVDHWDHRGLNNQRSNMRMVTQNQNMANRRSKTGRSRFKGVTWGRTKWVVEICKDQKSYYLGRFEDEIQAARAYDAAASNLFGEFANLNLWPSSRHGR